MSERAQRYFLWILAAALVAGTGLALRYAKNYRDQAASFVPGAGGFLPGGINLRFQNVTIVGRKNGQKAWTVKADRVDTTKERNRVEFAGNLRAVLYQDKKVRAKFSAPFANYDAVGQNLTAFGALACDVWDEKSNASAPAPFHISAGQLFWGVGSQTLRCAGPVTATGPGATITGNDIVVDLRTRDYTLQNLNARFTITEGGSFPAGSTILPEGATP